MDLTEEMERDSQRDNLTQQMANDSSIRRIADLAKRQMEIERRMNELNGEISYLQKELDDIRDRELSDLLLGIGIREIKLEDGSKLTIDRLVFASVTKEKEDSAFKWLEDHNFSSLVKSSIIIDAGKNPLKKSQLDSVKSMAINAGLDIKEKATIHPQTLKAFVSEQMDKMGDGFPSELFGVYVINRSKIK